MNFKTLQKRQNLSQCSCFLLFLVSKCMNDDKTSNNADTTNKVSLTWSCIVYVLGRTNHSKSGPNDPTFFSWMGVHALMAVRTLTLSLVKYLHDAVDFCETAQLPLWSLSVEKLWVSIFILQSLIDPKPCPFILGHTLWATFRVIHALHNLP